MTILIILFAIAVIIVVSNYAGKCEKCGSWQNKLHPEPGQSSDDVLIFGVVELFSECKKCGHVKHGFRSTSIP